MIEVVRARLDARQRYRWHVALARKPVLAEREPRPRGPLLVAVWSAYLYVAMLAVIACEGAWGVGSGVFAALAAGGTVLVVHTGLWAWREGRATWPSGRFLFTWGYVEVEHDRLRYVAGGELEHEVVRLEGGRCEVRLRAHGMTTSFGLPLEDAPLEALARLGTPEPSPLVDGYRDAPWIVEGPPAPRRRLSRRERVLVSVGLAAIVGGALSPYLGTITRALQPAGPSRTGWERDYPIAASRVLAAPRDPRNAHLPAGTK